MRGGSVLWPILLLAVPAVVSAQDCFVVRSEGESGGSNIGTPNQVTYVAKAEISCPGGKRLYADNTTSIAATGRIELNGNVRYSDPTRTLTADRAEYYKQQALIHAAGNVVIRDLKTGSTIYGQDVNYYQASATRPEALLEAIPATVRPRAVLREESGKGRMAGDSVLLGANRRARRDSTTVVADMIQVLGDRHFRGLGSAVITRDSMTAYGGIADYDQATGEMQLTVQGRIEGGNYRLLGDTIKALIEGDTLRNVTAIQNGKLTTEEVTVDAARIRIELQAGQVERMVASRPAAGAGATRPPQPRILAKDFTLTADSIDVLAPGQELKEVVAIGGAFSSTNDTIPAPPDVGELANALSTDWMRGDTVHAYFSANPRAAQDTAANSRVLDRVVSSGSPASSLYRRRESPAASRAAPDSVRVGAPPEYSIGYLLARRIEVVMADGEVKDVNASEDVRGIYLQPRTANAAQAARRNGRTQ